jgi:hypothetical protein
MREPDSAYLPWWVTGTYFESCNCDPICPCRMVGGRPGGRSTHGICFGVLSWRIEDGRAGETELGGLNTALVLRYDDDEPGSPWRFVLHLDERSDDAQREALELLFLGKLGGEQVLGLPWVRKLSHVIDVRSSRIEIEHDRRSHSLRVKDAVTLEAARPFPTAERVSCVIPGHHQPGTELYADRLRVSDDPYEWDLEEKCAFVSDFRYESD